MAESRRRVYIVDMNFNDPNGAEMHFTHDPYDAEWENPNTGRTVYRPGEDDCDETCEGTDDCDCADLS